MSIRAFCAKNYKTEKQAYRYSEGSSSSSTGLLEAAAAVSRSTRLRSFTVHARSGLNRQPTAAAADLTGHFGRG